MFWASDISENAHRCYEVKAFGLNRHTQLIIQPKESRQNNWGGFLSRPALALWFAVFLVCTLAGPFGTYIDLELPQRGSYWALVISACAVCAAISHVIVQRLGPPKSILISDLLLLSVITLIIVPWVWYIGQLFETDFMLNSISIGRLLFYVFTLNVVAFFAFRTIIQKFASRKFADDPELASTRRVPLLQRRISHMLDGDIIRLSSNGHHVDVHTTDGSAQFRMRLTDAIEAMEPVDGFCCHRSHWVASAHARKLEQENAHKLWLVLSNGDRVPVSRKYRVRIKNIGL